MTTPLKHAEFIKAWADGAEIEYFDKHYQTWKKCANNWPQWVDSTLYRVKPQPHKWQHLIDAQAAGKICQMHRDGEWVDGYWEFSNPKREYRLKPEKQKIKYRVFIWRTQFGAAVKAVASLCTYEEQMKEPRENWAGFVMWVSPWIEIEVETTRLPPP